MSPKRVTRWHVVAACCGILLAFAALKLIPREPPAALASLPDAGDSAPPEELLEVKVVKPSEGGLDRSTTLPATVVAFESAKLFAKIPGYLKSQAVDIGDFVHRGDVLAEIDSPETVKALDQAKAAVEQAKAQVAQSDAHITTAEADHEAALAAIKKAQAGVSRYTSSRELREKQLNRIVSLHRSDSIEKRLVDEQENELQSARSAEDGAVAEVANTQALANAAAARITQAKADAFAARANLEVAEAALDKAEVFVEYLKIVSPYDGVVVNRNFFRGDFIRSADQQALPLLAVDRTDQMRVIVQVPDLNVPFTRKGAPALVKIDALPGTRFESCVARVATAEDSDTRTMCAEIDLKNDQGLLCQGMYGYVTIQLPSSAGAQRIPTVALVGAITEGTGSVCVIKDGVVKVIKVHVGRDDGAQVEILDGLSADDFVAVSHTTDLVEGMHVTALPAGEKPRS